MPGKIFDEIVSSLISQCFHSKRSGFNFQIIQFGYGVADSLTVHSKLLCFSEEISDAVRSYAFYIYKSWASFYFYVTSSCFSLVSRRFKDL